MAPKKHPLELHFRIKCKFSAVPRSTLSALEPTLAPTANLNGPTTAQDQIFIDIGSISDRCWSDCLGFLTPFGHTVTTPRNPQPTTQKILGPISDEFGPNFIQNSELIHMSFNCHPTAQKPINTNLLITLRWTRHAHWASDEPTRVPFRYGLSPCRWIPTRGTTNTPANNLRH